MQQLTITFTSLFPSLISQATVYLHLFSTVIQVELFQEGSVTTTRELTCLSQFVKVSYFYIGGKSSMQGGILFFSFKFVLQPSSSVF